MVSAGPDRSDGVMVLVSPKFKQSQVKYDEIVKGRLLRVQLAVDDARVEVFCCYQFVWQTELTKDDNLRRRQVVLDKLCTQVRAIARRSTVVVLGDFNAELVPSPGRVGQSLANTPRHVGLRTISSCTHSCLGRNGASRLEYLVFEDSSH